MVSISVTKSVLCMVRNESLNITEYLWRTVVSIPDSAARITLGSSIWKIFNNEIIRFKPYTADTEDLVLHNQYRFTSAYARTLNLWSRRAISPWSTSGMSFGNSSTFFFFSGGGSILKQNEVISPVLLVASSVCTSWITKTSLKVFLQTDKLLYIQYEKSTTKTHKKWTSPIRKLFLEQIILTLKSMLYIVYNYEMVDRKLTSVCISINQ